MHDRSPCTSPNWREDVHHPRVCPEACRHCNILRDPIRHDVDAGAVCTMCRPQPRRNRRLRQPDDARSATLPPTRAFDVASIHPNNSDHTARTHIYSYANQGHFIAINATPDATAGIRLQFTRLAHPRRIAAGLRRRNTTLKPSPIQALADKLALLSYPDAKDQLLKMVQLLLADRFHLAAHRESRELPVYELVAAKRG